MEHCLASGALLCCKWPPEQRHVLPGYTSFSAQILKSLVILHISTPDGSSFHRKEQTKGQGLSVCLRNPLEAKSQILNCYAGCHQTRRLLPFPLGQPEGLSRTFPSCLLPSKGKKEMQRHHMQREWTLVQFYDGLIQLSCKSICGCYFVES